MIGQYFIEIVHTTKKDGEVISYDKSKEKYTVKNVSLSNTSNPGNMATQSTKFRAELVICGNETAINRIEKNDTLIFNGIKYIVDFKPVLNNPLDQPRLRQLIIEASR